MRFVCWLWQGRDFLRENAEYGPAHVAALASMLARHGGHRLTVVTDRPEECQELGATIVPMPAAVAAMPELMPKLWAWSPDFHRIVGEPFASIDLDVVITGDLGPVLRSSAVSAPIRLWRERTGREPYNTSLFAVVPGNGCDVWIRLSPASIARAKAAASYWVGDQSWVASVLRPDLPTFGEEDGIIQYRPKLHRAAMPPGMIAGFMCGPCEPAGEAAHSEWVRAAWC